MATPYFVCVHSKDIKYTLIKKNHCLCILTQRKNKLIRSNET